MPEIRIYCELKQLFPTTVSREKIEGFEIDIYIPELKVGIEYDGSYWHKNRDKNDRKKNLLLEPKISLIRIREKGLSKISASDIEHNPKHLTNELVKKILNLILIRKSNISIDKLGIIQNYFKNKNWISDTLFKKIFSERNLIDFEKSLKFKFPKLVEEWHPTKNENLLPENFLPFSAKKVWWKAKCGHEWEALISNRTSNGTGCPKCWDRKAMQTRLKKMKSPGQLDLIDL
jgi:very-short-patch-repair endonuclease